ncbi:Protein AGMO-1 [Aphelenchoides avenae]|nr:Protein AGMO-1 [Aphelenchus avenae]
MFHTFEPERPDDPPIYGLVTNEKTFNQLWLQFHTLKELLFDKWRSKDEKGNPIFVGPKEKLKAIFFPPGYFPGTKVVAFFHWFSMADPKEGVPEVSFRSS